jgi:hypothetical protein
MAETGLSQLPKGPGIIHHPPHFKRWKAVTHKTLHPFVSIYVVAAPVFVHMPHFFHCARLLSINDSLRASPTVNLLQYVPYRFSITNLQCAKSRNGDIAAAATPQP